MCRKLYNHMIVNLTIFLERVSQEVSSINVRWAKCAHTYMQQEIVRYTQLGYFFSSPISYIQWRIGTSRGFQRLCPKQ